MSKDEIIKIVLSGKNGKNSHCIIYCDHWDYTYSYKYIDNSQNIKKVIEDIKSNGSIGMYTIVEIYNYNLDIEKQLEESRAYHIEPINNKIVEEHTNNISKRLEKTIDYATKMHEGQTRLNGEPYINHPLHVVQNVLKYKKSKNIEELLMAACLHDIIEDTEATYYDITSKFGPMVASLVLELTTDEDMKNALGKKQYLSIKMRNMSSWALVIKLCDRLDNVNDLINCNNEEFKNKYINETICILNYLIINRELSKTHLTIIEQIIIKLLKITKSNNEEVIKLIKKCNILINESNNNDNLIKRIKI